MLNNQEKIILPRTSTQSLLQQLAPLAKPVVFTNGCFDILHRGHVTYLEQARNLGGSMIVGVNTDASVKRQGKGDDRPLNSLEDRMAVLAALSAVDAVIAFDDDTPEKLIELVKPNILVKGGDWPIEQIVGADWVLAHGGSVHSIAFEHDRSTTSLVEKIRQR